MNELTLRKSVRASFDKYGGRINLALRICTENIISDDYEVV